MRPAPPAYPNGGDEHRSARRYPRLRRLRPGRSPVTAAQFEQLTASEVECLLRHRLNLFLDAGAAPCAALVLAAQVEVPEEAAVELLEQGFSVDLTLRLLYTVE